MVEKVQTIELTSKRFKKQQLFASIAIVAGIMAIAVDLGVNEKDPSIAVRVLGSLFLISGLIWFGIVRVRIWWHHG